MQTEPMKNPVDLSVGEAVYYSWEKAIGIVYETYTWVEGSGERPGVSVLLSNGRDFSGFSATEADRCLQPLGHTGLSYTFQSVDQLSQDYNRGYFSEAFALAQALAVLRPT